MIVFMWTLSQILTHLIILQIGDKAVILQRIVLVAINNTLSSHKRGKWSKISKGSVSAARMINSAKPRFSVFVAEKKEEQVIIAFKYQMF